MYSNSERSVRIQRYYINTVIRWTNHIKCVLQTVKKVKETKCVLQTVKKVKETTLIGLRL